MARRRDHDRRLLGFARRMRHEATDVERRMWALLRDRRLEGFKFRRQYPVGGYIVDFVCLSGRLVIEVDGGQHGEADQMEYDERRSRCLEGMGMRVCGFWIGMC